MHQAAAPPYRGCSDEAGAGLRDQPDRLALAAICGSEAVWQPTLQCWPMACIAQVLPVMVVAQPASVKTHRRLIALKADPAAAAMADAPSLAALGRLAGRAGSTKSWSHQARQANMAPTGLCRTMPVLA